MEITRLFLDTEFTGLHQHATLISLSLYLNEQQYFYAEFADVNLEQLTPWLRQHVVPKLDYQQRSCFYYREDNIIRIKNDKAIITAELQSWLQSFENIEIWADVLAYDWVLFCELFGGAIHLPSNIFYAPFDLATAFRLQGLIQPAGQYNGDISRYEFAGMDAAQQHHALEDCRAEKACFDQLEKAIFQL